MWFKVDDEFYDNPKVARTGPLGIALYICGLAYCNRNLTDGFIPLPVAARLLSFEFPDPDSTKLFSVATTCGMSGDDVDSDFVINLLVKAGLWEVEKGGYRVHDYLLHQRSKAEILAKREATRIRVNNHRVRERNAVTDSVTNGDVTREVRLLRSKDLSRALDSAEAPIPTVTHGRSSRPKLLPPAAPAEFEQFWAAYPKKKAKGDAEKAWKALRPDGALVERILRAVDAQVDSEDWRKDHGQFIPYPASWLRQKRWEDTIDGNSVPHRTLAQLLGEEP